MSEKKYAFRPIDINLEVPYYMPLKIYNEFMKRFRKEKKFVIMAIENAHSRGEGVVLTIKLALEW